MSNKNKSSRGKNTGFTLVELLAVIVILAIILVIAVPKVMDVINDATKASLESSAKMVASQVENQYTVAQTLGKEFGETGSCMQEWAGINTNDYASCTYEITSDGEAKVILKGGGKFKGLSVCNATRSEAIAIEGECAPTVNAVSFSSDDWATIVAAVQSGNYPYQVEDTKTIDLGDLGEHTIRVSNTKPCSEVSVESKTACGFVLEFADLIINNHMNEDGYNTGGWPESDMRAYVNETIYNSLPEDLKNGIIDTYAVSGHGSDDVGTLTNGNFASTDKLYLLSPQEVYGTSFDEEEDTSVGTTRQLDYYEINDVSVENYAGASKNFINYISDDINWWLRSALANNSSSFILVNQYGARNWEGASSGPDNMYVQIAVSPAFRLSN